MKAITLEMVVTGVSASNRTGGLQGRKIGQSEIPNWTIRLPRRHQQPLVSNKSSGCPRPDLLLMDQG
jgi:hypothetical protein